MPAIYLATGHSSGEECSSTGEGRHITLEESLITHPSHTDGFVDKGDPVLFGENGVGVAFDAAAAATDLIAIDTEGIWYLTATGSNEDGNSAIALGDEIFIHKTTAVLSKIPNKSSHAFFGYALGDVTGGASAVVAIKVHFDPDDATELVGTSAAPHALGTVNLNGREYRYRSTATAGDVRGMYMALGFNGIGAGGEAVRARSIVEAVGVTTVHGLHGGVEFDADGELTGLAAGVRATFMAPDRSHAGGEVHGGISELYAGGASSDFGAFTMHSIHLFAMSGDGTGKATADNVFEFAGLSAVQYANNTDTPAKALRVIINGDVRYIMVSEAQS